MVSEKKETDKVAEPTAKKVKIIWQSPKGPNAKIELVTIQDIDSKSKTLDEYASIKPNYVGQYVLVSTAKDYDRQVEAMEIYAEKYGLKRVDFKMEGILPTSYEGMNIPEINEAVVSSLRDQLAKAQKENEELIKKLAKADK